MKSLLWFATVLFFLLSWWWYVCPHKKVCPFGTYYNAAQVVSAPNGAGPETSEKSEVSTPATTPKSTIGPLVFNWSSDVPITGDGFAQYRDSISALLGDNDLLEILGGYFGDETNNSSFSDLGLARANEIRDLFKNLPDNRIDLKSAVFQRDPGSERERPFLASHFRKIINNESVREEEGRMIINFPHASDEMLSNAKLNEYVDGLIVRLKNTKEKVHLTGHTDSSASSNRNMSLGLQRAEAIKNLLVLKGLAASRISTESKGETAPIASNDSPDGRQQNRRVELTIIP